MLTQHKQEPNSDEYWTFSKPVIHQYNGFNTESNRIIATSLYTIRYVDSNKGIYFDLSETLSHLFHECNKLHYLKG